MKTATKLSGLAKKVVGKINKAVTAAPAKPKPKPSPVEKAQGKDIAKAQEAARHLAAQTDKVVGHKFVTANNPADRKLRRADFEEETRKLGAMLGLFQKSFRFDPDRPTGNPQLKTAEAEAGRAAEALKQAKRELAAVPAAAAGRQATGAANARPAAGEARGQAARPAAGEAGPGAKAPIRAPERMANQLLHMGQEILLAVRKTEAEPDAVKRAAAKAQLEKSMEGYRQLLQRVRDKDYETGDKANVRKLLHQYKQAGKVLKEVKEVTAARDKEGEHKGQGMTHAFNAKLDAFLKDEAYDRIRRFDRFAQTAVAMDPAKLLADQKALERLQKLGAYRGLVQKAEASAEALARDEAALKPVLASSKALTDLIDRRKLQALNVRRNLLKHLLQTTIPALEKRLAELHDQLAAESPFEDLDQKG